MEAKINGLIADYQRLFARAVDARYAYSFWKGRVALYAILRALKIGAEDEVILPGFTCVVVPNAVRFVGATPVYADIATGSFNLDPASVRKLITPRTRVLIIQHTFGIPADMDSLLDIARQNRLAVIEDCAHALGSRFRGQTVGTFGAAAFFSSQWSKPFTTGLGGTAVTSDVEVSDRLRCVQAEFSEPPSGQRMKLQAQYLVYQRLFSPKLYWLAVNTLQRLSDLNIFVGSSGKEELNSAMPDDTTWRMSSFQAQAGLKQLKKISENLAHRRLLAEFYEAYLSDRGWPPPLTPEQAQTVYLRYPVRVANKTALLSKAEQNQVELGSWFESALHPIQTSLERFGYTQGQCAVAERTADEVLNLPLHSRVTIKEAERVAEFFCKHAEKPVTWD